MASSNVDSSEPRLSRESSLKRSLSISKSLKGLFKSGGGNSNAGTSAATAAAPSSISTPEVPTLATKDKQDRLKNLATNKEKELQTSRRGVASPSLSPTRHVSLSNLAKLSITSRAGAGQVDPNVIHETSPLASDEESTDLAFGKRQSSSNRSSSLSNEEQEPNNKYPLPEKLMGDLDEMVCGSIDTQLSKSPDTVEAAPLRRSRSTQRKRLNSFSLRPRALSNPGQNPIHPVENRERSNTSSIDLLMSHEPESRAIYKSDQFSVYPDGHHIHHLKVVPIVHDLEQSLNKPKSSFSFSGFFKTHRTIADDGENLATALSLLPANRFSFHKRLSQIIDEENGGNHNADEEHELNGNSAVDSDSDADYGNQSSGSSNPSDDESESDEDGYKGPSKSASVPKIVNEKSVIGASELKLINQLTEKIDNGFCLKGSKPDAVSSCETSSASRKQHLCEKYGKSIGIIGQGAYGVVKLCYKFIDPDEPGLKDNTYCHDNKLFYAVKELKPRPDEPPKKFSTRLTSEFVIGLSLSGGNKSRRSSARTHPNILNVIDLMQTPNAFYEVMEFCPSGDLYSLITRTSKSDSVLHPLEADCFMKQLLHGIQYMHAHGVAHCDIKPENLLFLPTGVLKICDFGTSSVFQTAWEKKAHFQTGPAGSEPYVAPEEFIPKQQYDPRLVDCWSCGIIYCVMVLGHYLWKIAIKGKDSVYDAFLEDMEKHGQYYVFDEMKHVSPDMNRYRTAALYHIFQVDPNKRITVDSLLKSSWMKRTKCCVTYPPKPV